MKKALFCLLFSTAALPAFCQQQSPVFGNRADSVAFEEANARFMEAMRNPQLDTQFDSLAARLMRLRNKAVRFRTSYQPTTWFTPYSRLPKDLSTVTKLSLSGNQWTRIPDSVYLCTNLADLELVNTAIKVLPRQLENLKQLKKVSLLNNRPRGRLRLTQNQSLETLVIHDDETNHLPRRYGRLKQLETLDLGRCALTKLPNLTGSKSVKRLVLNDNRIRLDKVRRQYLQLEELNLVANGITSLPSTIGSMKNLRKLNLNNNQITTIAPEISNLVHLEQLFLYRSSLKSIPPDLYQLKNLKAIDLYYNQLTQLDPEIANWSKLEILYAANNKLFTLPDNLGKLTQLRELYLHHNKLSSLPDLGALDSLRVLRINNNFLVEYPHSLYGLESIENLDVASNQVQTFEEALFDYPRLRIISLKNNPIDPALRESVKQWAARATRSRNVVVHLEGPAERETESTSRP